MRALIVGWGSMGKRHASCLRKLVPHCEILICRSRPQSRLEGSGRIAEHGRFIPTLTDAIEEKPDFAIVANPAPFHIQVVSRLAERGIPILVEKPLSNKAGDIAALKAMCVDQSLPVMVGYVLRFHPLLRAALHELRTGAIGRPVTARLEVGQYLPDWRPEVDWRQSVSARRDLGGGALLELSHEIDVACWFFGKPESVAAVIPPSTLPGIDVEDAADLSIEMSDGVVVEIRMDMLRRPQRRQIVVVGTKGRMEIDLLTGAGRLGPGSDGLWTEMPAAEVDRDDIYLRELSYFLQCVENETSPEVGLDEGEVVLRVIDAARRSASQGGRVVL